MNTEPGTATVVRHDDGTRTVAHADPTIAVSVELLADPTLDPDMVEPDGTLRLDTKGEHRYRFARAESDRVQIYERITAPTGPADFPGPDPAR